MTITVCDICGSKNNVKRLVLLLGKVADGAGGHDNEYAYPELCPVCEVIAIRSAITELFKSKAIEETTLTVMYNKLVLKHIGTTKKLYRP